MTTLNDTIETAVNFDDVDTSAESLWFRILGKLDDLVEGTLGNLDMAEGQVEDRDYYYFSGWDCF